MMSDELDRLAARAAIAVREVAEVTADPDGDLAAIYAAAGPLEVAPRRSGHPLRWLAVAAASVAVVVAATAFARWGGTDDTRLVPATLPPATTSSPTTPSPATTAPLGSVVMPPVTPPTTPPTSTSTVPVTTTTIFDTTVARSSPLELFATCDGPACPEVQYAANGLPVAYDFASRTMTVLEPTPRSLTVDIAESRGRFIAVGPDLVAYLLVESADEPWPGRIVAVPTSGDRAGAVYEIVGPTAGLGSVWVNPEASGISVVECCGVGLTDSEHPYVDADGAPLQNDPTKTAWSWTWPENRAVVIDNDTGQDYEVPQDRPDREGSRSGDLRPLLDGRVVVIEGVSTGTNGTAWVLDPTTGTWTSTDLGDVAAWDVDPAGAVLTRDRSTLAYGLVPLD